MSSETQGASPNEQLLYAAKQDDEELMKNVLAMPGVDVNYADGLGNTALHWAASNASVNVIEPLLDADNCDIDPINRLDKATPLHMAVRIKDVESRHYIVQMLLDYGADMSIRDKQNSLAEDLLPGDDADGKKLFRSAQAENQISNADIADDDDDDGEPGSGSDDD